MGYSGLACAFTEELATQRSQLLDAAVQRMSASIMAAVSVDVVRVTAWGTASFHSLPCAFCTFFCMCVVNANSGVHGC